MTCKREELPGHYQAMIRDNPLLSRVEEHAKTIGWTDEETRTFQLFLACASNVSLTNRVRELETALSKK